MFIRFFAAFTAYMCLSAGMAEAQPWSTPFNKNVDAIREAAKAIKVPEKATARILLDEHLFSVDSSGRVTQTRRLVYQVLDEDGSEDWSSIEQAFEPWHQAKPQLRARVLGKDGAVHLLDPKTVSEAPVREFSASVFSDNRVMRGPLPAIGPGAIVETEVVVRDTSARFAAGVSARIAVNRFAPVERFHVRVEAPASVPLKALVRMMPGTALKQANAGRTVIAECDFGPYRPADVVEFELPSDVPSAPYFAFSTAASWNEVAAQYGAIVETQIRGANLSSLMPAQTPTGSSRVIAAALTARLHEEIRYTGVEFGEAAIVPRSPAETLRRRFGDCKDKAALLVAMLRNAGLEARIALLQSGFETDIDAELPGFGLFNHAIVYVGGERPFWIDATADGSSIANLPLGDTGRLALIAAPETKGLTRTPEPSSSDNRRIHVVEVWMSSMGTGRIVETIEATGAFDTFFRQTYSGDKPNREALEKYAKDTYLSRSLGDIEVTPKRDFAAEFRIKLEMREAGRSATEQEQAVVATLPYLLFAELPWVLSAGSEEDDGDKTKRQSPFLMTNPQVIEYRYRIHPPPLFRTADLPESGEWKWGPATYSRKVSSGPDGVVHADYRFDSGQRRITPSEFDAFRAGLKEHNKQQAEIIRLVYLPSQYLATGEAAKGIALARDHAAANATDAIAQVRLSRVLIAAGVTNPAIVAATRATELDPKSSDAWQALGWAFQHDPFSRRMRGKWNRTGAEKAFSQAMEIDPENVVPAADLAIMHEHTDTGERYGKRSRLKEAAAIYRRIDAKNSNPVLRSNLVAAMLFGGEWDQLRKILAVETANETERGVLLTIEAATAGPNRALATAQATIADPGAKARVLVGASANLAALRKYEAARDLLQAVVRLRIAPEAEARLAMMSRLKPLETVMFPDSDPRSAVQKLFLELLTEELDEGNLKELFTSLETWDNASEQMIAIRSGFAGLRAQFAAAGIPIQMAADLLITNLELSKEGDDALGYEIKAAGPFGPGMPVMYVVSEGNRYRVLASTTGLGTIGRLVNVLLEKGDIRTAQSWLDRAAAAATAKTSDGTGYPAVRYLWAGVKEESRGTEAIRTAAAALISHENESTESIAVLRKALNRATTDIQRRNLEIALCQAYAKARSWTDLLQTSRSLRTANMFEQDGRRFFWQALSGLERWSELRRDAEAALAKHAQDPLALRTLARALAHQGKLPEAAEKSALLARAGFAEGVDRIQAAWYSLLAGAPVTELEATLLKETESKTKASSAYWYALAAVQATSGKTSDAHRTLLTGLDHDHVSALDSRAWLVFGQLCLQLGLRDEARVWLERASKYDGKGLNSKWAGKLALRKLEELVRGNAGEPATTK